MGFIFAIFILGRVAYDNTIAFDIGKEKITVFKNPDFIPVKEFLLSKTTFTVKTHYCQTTFTVKTSGKELHIVV